MVMLHPKLTDRVHFIIGIIIIFVFFPVGILIACTLLIGSKESVFFRQTRGGLNGKPFRIYKFRTMNSRKDMNGNLFPDEDRLTRLGWFLRRSSLDELPQLINVLKGDMNIVGPRPLLLEYNDLYNEKHQRRLNVKPGITGLAQIKGRNGISWVEKFDLDVLYVQEQSLWLDISILFKTFTTVISSRNINAPNAATMPKFSGY